jgi:hypothetical protein
VLRGKVVPAEQYGLQQVKSAESGNCVDSLSAALAEILPDSSKSSDCSVAALSAIVAESFEEADPHEKEVPCAIVKVLDKNAKRSATEIRPVTNFLIAMVCAKI